MAETTEAKRALNGVELAVRRVADRMRGNMPDNLTVLVTMLDDLANEVSKINAGVPCR